MGTPERVIEIYNAIYGTHLPPDTPVKFNTLEGALYMNRINDISCTIGDEFVVLIEHQSSDNRNMPLCLLMYIGRLYEKMVDRSALYRHEIIKIPAPKFIVCYNGSAPLPERDVMNLSSAFMSESSSLELKVDVVNINYDTNATNPVLDASQSLSEYAQFVHTVREYAKTLPFEEAIKQAIIKCENSGVMKEFLRENGSEVRNVLFEEWNQEEAERVVREETIRQTIRLLKGTIEPDVIANRLGLNAEAILSIWNNTTPAT